MSRKEWLSENLKQLQLIAIIAASICGLMVLGYLFIDGFPGSTNPKYFAWNTVLSFINIVVIPLGIINTLYLFKHFFNSQSPWAFMFVKYVAVFIGVTFSTIICHIIAKYFAYAGLIHEVVATNITIQGHKLTPLEASLVFNNIVSFLISFPIFMKQSRNQEIALKLKEKELELNRVEHMKTQAQLEVLQSKINPHFLYNALNSIAGLAHDEPDKVEKMAISLSKLFRYSINTSSNNYSTIKEEIEIAKTYLEIEKIRFGDKLQYSLDIQADDQLKIPRFLIQPLVENSIKHGTSKITGQGNIKINIKGNANKLTISVHDNGPAFPDGLLSGYGLQSTQEKLKLLFTDNYELNFINGNDKHIRIILKNLIA